MATATKETKPVPPLTEADKTAAKTEAAINKAAKAPVEPDFDALTTQLASADAEARAASADAGQARAKRSTIAVATIKAAFAEKKIGPDIRKALLDGGVLKGTVSKIVTVIEALYEGHLTPNDVKSLNGAYNLVKTVRAAHTGGVAGPGAAGAATPAPTIVKGATTPEAALKLIIDSIKAEKDADKQFKLGGDWITKITNAITDALKDGDGGDDEEEELG